MIGYSTRRFLCQCQKGQLYAASHSAFFTRVLEQTQRPIVLIEDDANYSTSGTMQRFFAAQARPFAVFQLPSYSPAYTPIEKRRTNVKKGTPLHYFPVFEVLTNKVAHRLLKFPKTPVRIQALGSVPIALVLIAYVSPLRKSFS